MTQTLSRQETPVSPPPPAPPRRKKHRDPSRFFRLYLPLVLYLLFTLIPFYWMLVFAFRPAGETTLLPWPITFEHFDTVWNDIGFGLFFQNSLLIALGTLVTVTVFAVMGGYALARFKFRGQRVFLLALLCTQFIPGAMMLIPLFVIFKNVGLLNSLTGLIIADTAFQLPLALILMSGFVRNVPVELEEAAMVDGCSRLRAFFAVTLPQLRPALVAVGSFAFIGAWNNFLFALMFASRQDKFTLPVGLSYALGEFNTDFGALAAGGVVAAVPVVLVFAVVQRFLVQGLSAGAVKG
ncbi:carbohydrate ABC transporter permease [Lentzea sp. PSKA42]|uniref:Carbohydrate ABC transporter permease n=1 Tax=Lentzea indica TaxID=2604800 RepID=A0ABX1FP75_9PSEU|nr:carbohydrate ABC transporter permease [Lentzea indica]NKE60720.1 carbohydrate ABC transporter permease [Lentzea indica]